VDADGKPVSGVRVRSDHNLPAPGIWPADVGRDEAVFTGGTSGRFRPGAGSAAVGGETKTDEEGRFRLECFDTTLNRDLDLSGVRTLRWSDTPLKGLAVKPGEVKDLGDIRVPFKSTKE